MNKNSIPKRKITDIEKKFLQTLLPRPPNDASEDEMHRFQAIVGKIKPAWHEELGRWYNDYSELTKADHFSIGNTGTKEWPLFVPQEAKAVLKAMRPRRNMGEHTVVMPITENNPDLAEAHERAREELRKLTPAIEHGKKHLEGQKKKSQLLRKIKNDSGETLDEVIEGLAKSHPNDHPKELWPHLKSAILEWSCSDCDEVKPDDKKRDSWLYRFTKSDGKVDTITYQTFRKKLSARKRQAGN